MSQRLVRGNTGRLRLTLYRVMLLLAFGPLLAQNTLPVAAQTATHVPARSTAGMPDQLAPAREVAAEPRYSPRPGRQSGNVEVSLSSATPGSVIHYTVDGSQPTLASSVYRAPIIVSGTALTIKAFAAARGKKDSAVVTASYYIHE